MGKNSCKIVRNKLEAIKGGVKKMLIDYFKTPAEDYVLRVTPMNLLKEIIEINNEFETQKHIIRWEKADESENIGEFPVEIHNKDSRNQENLFIEEDYLKYIAKRLGLLKPEWEEGKYNIKLVELMLNNFTISDIIQIDIWIRRLFYEKSIVISVDYEEGIPNIIELPGDFKYISTLEKVTHEFFKENNATDSLNNCLGHLLVQYCLYYAFDN